MNVVRMQPARSCGFFQASLHLPARMWRCPRSLAITGDTVGSWRIICAFTQYGINSSSHGMLSGMSSLMLIVLWASMAGNEQQPVTAQRMFYMHYYILHLSNLCCRKCHVPANTTESGRKRNKGQLCRFFVEDCRGNGSESSQKASVRFAQ